MRATPVAAERPAVGVMATRLGRSPAAARPSAAHELLVRDPVRPVGLGAQQRAAALLVGVEVALEPGDLRVAFEREDVRRYSVEEPAIVRYHDRTAGKAQQRVLQRTQR